MVEHTMYRVCIGTQLFLWISLGLAVTNRESIQTDCQTRCEATSVYSAGANLFCDVECQLRQCHRGCQLYTEALSSSCQSACTSSQPGDQQCVRGCNHALDVYADRVRVQLGRLPEPELIRETKNYSSAVLQWSGRVLPEASYLLQKQVVDAGSDWQAHEHATVHRNGQIAVTQLHPYVTYKFKVLVVVTPTHVFPSPPSIPITTLPHGAPSSAPTIGSVSASSPSVIALAWQPPVFTNGPLLGYRITLEPLGHPELRKVTREVPASSTAWTFRQLQSAQRYRLALAALNRHGQGPSATAQLTTPNPGNLSMTETPFLIIGADDQVLKINVLDIVRVPDTVHADPQRQILVTDFETLLGNESDVEGLGVHVRKQMVLVSGSDGNVHSVNASAGGPGGKRNLYPSILRPAALSVDWLNDRAYIVSRNRIYSCPLDRDVCFVIVDDLPVEPGDVKVDPLNGYLYFSQLGQGRGLYRVAISSASRGRPGRPELVVASDSLRAFALDMSSMQLYFPGSGGATMLSAFLDGTDVTDIRAANRQLDFSHASSLVIHNGSFIWTNGTQAWLEELDHENNRYQNPLLLFNKHYCGFNLFHPIYQPIPVPRTTPGRLEAFFTDSLAHVAWRPPELLQYQGQGAWDQWAYELEVVDMEGRGDRRLYSVEGLELEVEGLLPDSQYSLRVRALVDTSKGPWSPPFIGRTFKPEALTVKALLGLPHAILEADILQQSVQTVVNFPFNPTDIAWHGELILWTTSSGQLFVYNRQTQQRRQFQGITFAACLAFDWLAAKVFWSEPQQGVIKRADVLGQEVDFVYQSAARDLAVDAVGGRLYWTTTNSLESAFLNGQDHLVLFSVPFFSGRHVISLTLNWDLARVFWYVKGFQQQDLYTADLIGPGGTNASNVLASVRPVGDFRSIARTSGLQYFSERLFWLNQASVLVVGDLEGNYSSAVNPNNVTAFSISHPSIHMYPENASAEKVQVIPHPVKSSDIGVEGPSSAFNLTWSHASEVTHGQVFYKVFVRVGEQAFHQVTEENWHTIKGLSPYTLMAVSIQPYTYWGYADHTTVSVRSPMSKPSAPQTPRVYVTQHKDALTSEQSLAADFRWSTPAVTNGVLSFHLVFHWEGQGGAETRHEVPGTARHFYLNPLRANQTFFFQVAACTQVGCGPRSKVATAVTDSVNPVPRLLLGGTEGVRVAEVDGRLDARPLVAGVAVSALTFLAQDNVTFWSQQPGRLFSTASRDKPLAELNGTVVDLSMDWIGRALYVAERSAQGGSRLLAYFLDQGLLRPLLSRPAPVASLLTDPYSRSLFWTERDDSGRGLLYRSDVSGEGVVCLLGGCGTPQARRRRGADGPCSCSASLDVAPPLAVDYSDSGHTRLLLADKAANVLLASDVTGCNCSVVFQPSVANNQGLPPSLLTADHMRVYWWNQGEGMLYSISKQPASRSLVPEPLTNLSDILAYGHHLQPLPDYECLDPGAYSGSVQVARAGNTSLLLALQPVSRPPQCAPLSLPRDKFTLFYRPTGNASAPASPHPQNCAASTATSATPCHVLESYEQHVLVEGLQPYTEYLVQVAVSNYYTEYLAEALADPVVFRTLPGVPSPAVNVVASPLTPERLKVEWYPPAHPHGPPESLHYTITWATRTHDGAYVTDQVRLRNVTEDPKRPGRFRHIVNNLLPNLTYSVKVLTGAEGTAHWSESAAVTTSTFQLPGPILLAGASPRSLLLRWQSPSDDSIYLHHYFLARVEEGDALTWEQTDRFPTFTENATWYEFEIPGLLPNTRYAVAISAAYRVSPPCSFLWPRDDAYSFSTLSDVPDAPAPPEVVELKSDTHEVSWHAPGDDNGAAVTLYLLEYSVAGEEDWQAAYNGSRLQWTVEEGRLEPGRYVFRVKASNVNGWGPSSANSSVLLVTPLAENQTIVAVAVSLTFVIIFVIVVVIIAWFVMRRRQKDKKKLRQFVNVIRGPDMELANLRELPHTTVQQSNTLYSINIVPTAEHIAGLPHIRRDQLMLVRSLGSGAFGQVFQGLVRDPHDERAPAIRVAVKTLRKSADEGEKEEFLKEALLMSNFRHEHILGLLGVCLDNDPQFIIMELMEGGDLLSFMRSCRAQHNTPSCLKLPDLVKICVHVARGCKYLEENHFVHRDLAARNCLVSSKDPREMTVKIGDFGLARDIYKNDYYRKEGEGMLPVRWMSPESLVDGVFTTHSDIWAFGVLMWEVVTFGQQPYPARTNIEVLHFVRAGGKLERPEKCPDDMFSLMEHCWSLAPEDRPPFAAILQELENYAEKCALMTPGEVQEASPCGTDVVRDRTSSSPADLTDTVSTPRRWFHRTVGGSVRLTPTSKKKRLLSLLGQSGPEHEKLVVELPGSGRMKRTSSASLESGGRINYSQVLSFPRVAQLDSLGYLEPRAKHAPYYLQLIDDPADHPPSRGYPLPNGHARGPGQTDALGRERSRHVAGRQPLTSTASSTSSSVSPVAPHFPPSPPGLADRHPSASSGYERQASITSQEPPASLSSRERFPSSSSWDQLSWGRQPSVSSFEGPSGYAPVVKGSVSESGNPYSPLHRAGGRGYGRLPMQEPPPYPSTPDSAASWGSRCGEGGSQEELVGPESYGQRRALRSTSSSQGVEAPYYCAECYNHRCLDHGPQQARPHPDYSRVNEAAMCQDPPESPGASGDRGSPPAWSQGGHGEAARSLGGPAGYGRPGPEYVNSIGSSSHPHPGRSRNQVFPENASALAGFDIAQASLV